MDKKEFIEKGLEFVQEYASKNNEFLMEDIGYYAYAKGLPMPAETRWWGPIATKARALGVIEPSGRFAMSSKGKANARYMMVWRSKVV